MKSTTFFFIFFAIVFTTVAQSKSDKLYDVFAGKKGVNNFSFSKDMIDVIDFDLGDDENERNVTGDLQKVRFLSYNPEEGKLSGSEFQKQAVSLLPSRYKKYKDPDGEDPDSEIWLLGRGKKFSECHLFIKNEDDNQRQFIVSFYGDFTVNNLKELKNTGKGLAD